MFFLGPDGTKYRFFFRHDRYEHPKEALALHMRQLKGPKDDEEAVGAGQSWCSVEDNFNKETGRQIAVKRAATKVPAELRVPLLTAYFKRKRGKP